MIAPTHTTKIGEAPLIAASILSLSALTLSGLTAAGLLPSITGLVAGALGVGVAIITGIAIGLTAIFLLISIFVVVKTITAFTHKPKTQVVIQIDRSHVSLDKPEISREDLFSTEQNPYLDSHPNAQQEKNCRGYTVHIRNDCEPELNEDVSVYLERIFETYEKIDPSIPRGLIFAGYDFLHKCEPEHPSLPFLRNQIATLQRMGIKKIYLEQLHYQDQNQEEYSRYFSEEDIPLPKNINPESTRGIIFTLAKTHGMEVLGLEYNANSIATHHHRNDRRLINLNSVGSAIVKKIHEPFAVFVGLGHGKVRRDAPGMSCYLDCPVIGLYDVTDENARVFPGSFYYPEICGNEGFCVDAFIQ